LRVYIITDQEGVAGVKDFDNWGDTGSRYYEVGRRLCTAEVNAAIEGCLEAGADDIRVVDGHGSGSIDLELLHPAAECLMGPGMGGYPFGCDASFDCGLVIGQHAKAGTATGHLSHTGSLAVEELTVNGVSVGELGCNILFCSYFKVPIVAVSGDEACCAEARALIPNVETAAVKRGVSQLAAIHLHPTRAHALIREAAANGVRRRDEIARFWIEPPYVVRRVFIPKVGGYGMNVSESRGDDLIKVLNG
jgi:D-amino peptidase